MVPDSGLAFQLFGRRMLAGRSRQRTFDSIGAWRIGQTQFSSWLRF